MPSLSFGPWASIRSTFSDCPSAVLSCRRWCAKSRGALRGALTFKDAKHHLFFTQTPDGKLAARRFLERLKERTVDRDKAISLPAFRAQLKAVHAWGLQMPADLTGVRQPVLVANGEDDRMVPSSNSFDLAQRLPNAQLRLYHDAGHVGIFQYHEEFVKEALEFLEPAKGSAAGPG
jgi:pimeloyl-ACP methyl ester carboxylesterase